jgi:hypothetical protein
MRRTDGENRDRETCLRQGARRIQGACIAGAVADENDLAARGARLLQQRARHLQPEVGPAACARNRSGAGAGQ